MFTKKKMGKRFLPLILLLLFLIPFQAFFLTINTSTSNKNSLIEQNDEMKDFGEVKASLVDHESFQINETEIYENGTFYLYQFDYLFFSLENPQMDLDEEDTVQIQITHPVDGPLSVVTLTTNDNIEWNNSVQINSDAGLCQSTLNYTNGSETVVFDFSIDISEPVPSKITSVYAKDTSYNNDWTEIIEGGVYSTYRNTDFSFGVYTQGLETDPATLTLNYSDGLYEYTDIDITTTIDLGGFQILFNASAISILVNTTAGGENQWRPDAGLYSFRLNLDDVYFFEFFLEIKNQAPVITQLELTPSGVESPSGDKTSVDIILNASDFEDDILYNGASLKTAKYSDPVDRVYADGCTIEETGNLLDDDDEERYNITFGSSGGDFLFYIVLNQEIKIDNIDSFQTDVRMYDAYPSGKTNGSIQIYNYNLNEWITLEDRIFNFNSPYLSYVNDSLQLPGSAQDYVPNLNRTVKMRIHYKADASVQLSYVAFTTSMQRRETFSRVIVYISSPTGSVTTEREIINYWDSVNNYWRYQYNITNRPRNYGSWTFQVQVVDHGSTDYVENVWGNFSAGGASSSSKNSYPYATSTDSLKQYAKGNAYATRIFTLGLPTSEALNISSVPSINTSSTAIEHDQTFNVSIEVSGMDTTSLTEKDYVIRNNPTGFRLQKNATSTNSSGLSGTLMSPDYTTQGFPNNITDDDGNPWGIRLGPSSAGDWRHHTFLWQVQLEDWEELTKDNITGIFINLDSELNTSIGINEMWFEFWNYTSQEWTTPSSGTWNDATLYTSGEDFEKSITDKTDISHLSQTGIVYMRLNLDINSLNLTREYELAIDFLNVSTGYNFKYIAKVELFSSAMNPNGVFNLVPYAIDGWTMQYSYVFNIESMNMEPDNFNFHFTIKNGNSSTVYVSYRESYISIGGEFKLKYIHDQTEEIPYLSKNFTIGINEPTITVSDYITKFQNIRGGATLDSRLFYINSNYNDLNVSANLDLSTYNPANSFMKREFQIREGFRNIPSQWRDSSGAKTGTTEYTLRESISDALYDEEIYYIRYYIRTPFGTEFATSWEQYRIINFKPINFGFTFDNEQPLDFYRGTQYSFSFSFTDRDMTENEGDTAVDIRFKYYNKTSDQWKWLNATMGNDDYNPLNGRHTYSSCSITFPEDTRTGAFNETYTQWEFIVTDNNQGFESQIAYLNYTSTDFIIKNNPAYITGLTTSATQIARNNSIKIEFGLEDDDENNPILMEVVEFNITTPSGMLDWLSDNSSIKYDGTHELRYNTTFIERTAELGRYNVSLKVIDADGYITTAETYFNVINNAPSIESVMLSETSIYRNDTVTFYVNVTDVEDSWIQTKGSNPYAIERINLTITHEEEYRDRIRTVSPATDPIELSLSISQNGNLGLNHIEEWTVSFDFNQTLYGQYLYAGILNLEVEIEDSDGSVITGSGPNLEIINNAPELLSIKDEELGMEEAKSYFFENTINLGEIVDIYVFVRDVEGIVKIQLYYDPLVGSQEVKADSDPLEFTSDNWEEIYNGSNHLIGYKISFSTDILPEYTVKIEIDEILIFDTDFSYKHPSNQGATRALIEEFDDPYIVIGNPTPEPSVDWVVYIFMGIGIAAIVGVVVGGIIYYRKRSGWRKFLD